MIIIYPKRLPDKAFLLNQQTLVNGFMWHGKNSLWAVTIKKSGSPWKKDACRWQAEPPPATYIFCSCAKGRPSCASSRNFGNKFLWWTSPKLSAETQSFSFWCNTFGKANFLQQQAIFLNFDPNFRIAGRNFWKFCQQLLIEGPKF